MPDKIICSTNVDIHSILVHCSQFVQTLTDLHSVMISRWCLFIFTCSNEKVGNV